LFHILLRFREEVQDVVQCDIGLLPPQFDEAGNWRIFFFVFFKQ
jgi:hypothetical protein